MGQQIASVRVKAGLMMLQATLIEKRPFGRFFFARLSASLVRDNLSYHILLCLGVCGQKICFRYQGGEGIEMR